MRILFGKLGHEANTFSTERCDFNRFAPNGWVVGRDIFEMYRGKTNYVSGMIKAGEEYGVELVPTVSHLNAGPLMTRECLDYVVGVLMSYVEKHKDQIDGICLGLHGAGCAETAEDLEGYVLRSIRDVAGSDMPIAVTLDLHANVSPDTVRLSNGIFGVKQYPHTDKVETGYLAMETLVKILAREHDPETVLVKAPMLVTPLAGCTLEQPMKGVTDYVAEYAREHGLIDATFFHGFPYADVPHASASVVAVSEYGANEAARELAEHVWRMRVQLAPESLSPDEAIDRALRIAEDGYVVINESSDNPGGGAPGDGTYLLRALLKRDVPKTIFGFIRDPEIAALAHESGVGGRVSGLLGAKTDALHGDPIALQDAEVLFLSGGHGAYSTPILKGRPYSLGRTARLRVRNVEIIVSSMLPQQTFDDSPFSIAGADINQYRIVALKSTNHFKAFFRPRAAAIVTADPPGIQTSNLATLPYRRIRRPVFPIDRDAVFHTEVFGNARRSGG